ncbi:hypothetical protein [Gordonia sihwensis]|uniref:hypothetical protein n=1 Tax=Gordonia sihwensis TaxID=173559 RepID=UPI003D9555C0
MNPVGTPARGLAELMETIGRELAAAESAIADEREEGLLIALQNVAESSAAALAIVQNW